jgi:hypothetical protein
MPTSLKVIAECHKDHWAAWFDGYPKITRCGDCHEDAIHELFELFGAELFDVEHLVPVEDSTNAVHCEVIVPVRQRYYDQVAAMN